MATQPAIKVEGLDVTLRALRTIDPAALRALRKGFADVTKPIITKTKAVVPAKALSGWGDWNSSRDGRNLGFDQTAVRKGITSQVSVTRRAARLRLISKNPGGAIYENIGSKADQKQTNPYYIPQSKAFIRNISARHGKPGRLLVHTWKQEKGIKQTYKAVGRLIADAEKRVQEAIR
jgi:hypothetical protein